MHAAPEAVLMHVPRISAAARRHRFEATVIDVRARSKEIGNGLPPLPRC